MARAALFVALAVAGCGLISKDFDVEEPFVATGSGFSGTVDTAKLTGPLSSDLDKISSITLKAARIEATDGQGGIPFISSATVSISSQLLHAALLATLPAPPGANDTSAPLTVQQNVELKPFLQSGGTVSADVAYSPSPSAPRNLKLVLTLHGSLL